MNLTKFVITLFFYSTLNAYSQYFSGYVVKNNNDTIKCKFKNVSNMFWEEIFTPERVRYFAKIETLNGEKIKYKPSEIKCFVIKDVERLDLLTLPKKDLKFVSIEADGLNNFYLENFTGKISSYTLFDTDINARLKSKDFYLKNNELKKIRTFSKREDVGELINDYPELYEKWMDSNNFYTIDKIEEVILLYNEHFK